MTFESTKDNIVYDCNFRLKPFCSKEYWYPQTETTFQQCWKRMWFMDSVVHKRKLYSLRGTIAFNIALNDSYNHHYYFLLKVYGVKEYVDSSAHTRGIS